MIIHKTSFLVLVSSIFLFSCNGNGTMSEKDDVFTTEVAAQKKSITNIPSGFTTTTYVEYVAKNEEEAHFIHDMKEMLSARQNKDCKKIVELYYPDYIKLIQKEMPEKSDDEVKQLLVSYLEENVNEMNEAFINQWKDAKTAGLCITDIKNRVSEGDGVLFLYEYHNTLISETDSIFKEEAEYSVAASLNNGKTWYAITPEGGDWNQIFKLLEISFSHKAIDEVLTEK